MITYTIKNFQGKCIYAQQGLGKKAPIYGHKPVKKTKS